MICEAINSVRGALSWKACGFYLLISAATLFFTFLVYSGHGYAPVVWSGTCDPVTSKGSSYAMCDVDGRQVRDNISLSLLFDVLKNQKVLHCDVDTLDGVTCTAQ